MSITIDRRTKSLLIRNVIFPSEKLIKTILSIIRSKTIYSTNSKWSRAFKYFPTLRCFFPRRKYSTIPHNNTTRYVTTDVNILSWTASSYRSNRCITHQEMDLFAAWEAGCKWRMVLSAEQDALAVAWRCLLSHCEVGKAIRLRIRFSEVSGSSAIYLEDMCSRWRFEGHVINMSYGYVFRIQCDMRLVLTRLWGRVLKLSLSSLTLDQLWRIFLL